MRGFLDFTAQFIGSCRTVIARTWQRYSALEVFVLTLGAMAIFVLLTSLFTPLGEAGWTTRVTSEVRLADPAFRNAIEGITLSPFQIGETPVILEDGEEFFPDLIKEIEGAKRSITATNYIWTDDATGNGILALLVEKAKEGVQVRVLLDGIGGRTASQEHIDALHAAGGRVEFFRPLQFGKLTRSHRRTHVRAIVIDGTVGYTGGVAFADAWQGDGLQPDNWRDLMFKTSGVMTRSVQDVFASLWRESSGELLAGDDFYPPQSESSGDRTALFTHLFHTPNPDLNQSLAQLLWLSIHSSEDRIRIETPYLLPLDATYDAIIDKARSGVSIEIIVPGDKTDAPFVRAAARSYYRELLDAGVHIYEYQPALFHTKTIVADGIWSLIGSANLDSRSSILNVENVIGVVDPVLAAELEAIFEKDKSRSLRIDPETWEQGFFERMLGYVSRFFVKQY